MRNLIEIGHEQGRILQPRGFDTHATGSFVVADAPNGVARVQIFGPAGLAVGGFTLPAQRAPTMTVGTRVLSGLASIQYAGDYLLISHPESGALFTKYSPSGGAVRGLGSLRRTGYEDHRELHLALNAGLPLVDPTGGYFFVFLGGRPMFRKFDAEGRLMFERHIEGRELDESIASLPTRWPTRRVEDRELPVVELAVQRGCSGPAGPPLGVVEGAVHVRLRPRRPQGPHRAIHSGRHGQPDEPVLHA